MLSIIYFIILAIFADKILGPKTSNQKNKNAFEFNCGKNRIVREPFIYKSDSGVHKQIFISKNQIGSGSYSWVFAGYVRDRIDQLPMQKCVAIKLSKRKQSEAQNEMAIKLQKRSKCLVKTILGKRNRSSLSSHCDYIVPIFDTGSVSIEEAPIKLLLANVMQNERRQQQSAQGDKLATLGVTIMELGEETLHQRLYGNPMDFNDEIGAQLLNEQIRQIAKPLKALHKVAMHLDVKPLNFLYLKNEQGVNLLTLIDFDGAEILPKNTTCKSPDFKLGTTIYASPEYFKRCSMMSPKSDIWSLGVTIYEILLIQPHLGLYNKANPRTNQHNKMLRDIADIYKGFSFDKKEKQFDCATNDLDWLDGHIEQIEMLIRLWNEQHPRISLLLTGLLSFVHTSRPSADAVLEFMEDDQNCYFDLARSATDGSLMLFNGISAAKLAKLLEQRIDDSDPEQNVWLKGLDIEPAQFEKERHYFRQILVKFNEAIDAMRAEDNHRRTRDGAQKCGTNEQ